MKLTASNPVPFAKPASLGGALEVVRAWTPPALRPLLDRVGLSPVGRRLASGMFWTLTGNVLARALGLIASVVAARILGREAFGEFGAIQSTVAMVGAFAGMGLGITATKHVAEHRHTEPVRVGQLIAFSGLSAWLTGAVLAVALIVFSGALAEHVLKAPHLAGLLQVSAGLVFLGAAQGAQQGALAGLEAFKATARAGFWNGVFAFMLLAGGVYWGGLPGAVLGLVAGMAVNWLLFHFALRQEARRAGVPLVWRLSAAEWCREARLLWRFSLPAMIGSVMVLPVQWLCLALLARQPEGYSEMGLFTAANQWRVAILFVPQAMAGILLPALAGLQAPVEHRRHKRVFWSNVALIGGVGLVLSVGVIVCSDFIVRGYGEAFRAGRNTLVLLALSAVVLSINQVLGVGLISRGRMWEVLGCNVAWALALLGVSAWLVPLHGAAGLAAAFAISYPVQAVFMVWCLARLQPDPGTATPSSAGDQPPSSPS